MGLGKHQIWQNYQKSTKFNVGFCGNFIDRLLVLILNRWSVNFIVFSLRKLGYLEKKFVVRKFCERQAVFLAVNPTKKNVCLSQYFLTKKFFFEKKAICFFSKYPNFLKNTYTIFFRQRYVSLGEFKPPPSLYINNANFRNKTVCRWHYHKTNIC